LAAPDGVRDFIVMTNWQSELREGLKSKKDLENFFDYDFPQLNYQVLIPPTLASKIKKSGPGSILWKQFLPSTEELSSKGLLDPIGDEKFNLAPQIIHRYKNRALFMPTSVCPVYCRYCFRKNELGEKELFTPDFNKTLEYLKNHPEIEELIFSGGDPFILTTDKIDYYLSKFKDLKFIRFHTRTPVILPNRFDQKLLDTLKKHRSNFDQISIAIHTNHVYEIDLDIEKTIKKLGSLGVTLLSQTVLLKGINDSPETLKELFIKLTNLNIKSYYLHHPDQVKGGMHFHLSLEEGREIYLKLRDLLPGWAIPQYVIESPGGGGKVPAFNPETLTFSGKIMGKSGETSAF
jgi:lysine 2,3-aminomutase